MASGIVATEVSLKYGELTVLSKFDLRLKRGQSLVVTGVNGSGKSSLLQVCAGLVPPSTGTVLLDGFKSDLTRPSSLFRRGVRRGFVFENGGLLANRTALDNVTLPLRYHADLLELTEDAIDERARAALQEMRLTQAEYHSLPAHLSLGMRKRVSVARALALQPNFVFFDDPLTGLDAETQDLMRAILRRFREDVGVTMVIATSDLTALDYLELPAFELVNTFLLEKTQVEGFGQDVRVRRLGQDAARTPGSR